MSFFSRTWVRYTTVILILIVVGGIFLASKAGKKTPLLATVTRGTVTQEVSLTGSVKPLQALDLGFVTGGKVADIYVRTGDIVAAGDPLIALDASETSASLDQAKAALREAQANLASLIAGTRPEQITLDQVKVENDQQAVSDTKGILVNALQDGYTKMDDAVHNQGDQLFSNPLSSNPKFAYPLTDSVLQTRLESTRTLLESKLDYLQLIVFGLTPANDLSTSTAAEQSTLQLVSSFLEDLATAVNSLSTNANVSSADITAWKADISTARTNVSTATSNLSTDAKSVEDAIATQNVAQQQLALDRAGSTPQDIAADQAKVESAQANVVSIQAQLDQTVIRAPIAGVITNVVPLQGEVVTLGTTVVSMMSAHDFEIEADVPEVDIGSLTVGIPMTFTLDAFPDGNFTGKIIKIDPAEKIVEGVPTYTVTFSIDPTSVPIKSGMTANVTVVTAKKENVLTVPLRAVETRADGSYIGIVGPNNTRVETKIDTGLRGSDGTVEVSAGLSEGEQIFLDRATP